MTETKGTGHTPLDWRKAATGVDDYEGFIGGVLVARVVTDLVHIDDDQTVMEWQPGYHIGDGEFEEIPIDNETCLDPEKTKAAVDVWLRDLISSHYPAAPAMREALEYARPLVEKWCHYQGDNTEFIKQTLAPIDAALALTKEPEE